MIGLGIVGNLLGGVLNVATTHLESKAVVRKARGEAEAEVLKTVATHESKWEMAMAKSSGDSWKDEAWTILFIAVIVGCFVPGLQVHIEQGFYVLSNSTPEWFQYAVYMSIAASFGVRGLKRFTK
jgi:hypothetical protein